MTYDYICKTCEHKWEVQAKITDEPERVCPECKQETAQRQISCGIGFQLKGQGWFKSGGY